MYIFVEMKKNSLMIQCYFSIKLECLSICMRNELIFDEKLNECEKGWNEDFN